ncbi:Ca2+-dependent phosphoinositide-specific phospholipase C [Pectobacterium versatile]|uniref:Ca2+-dependent phosphoinositide-specific phospholipase C n=1 Tax=Pectobacterium versatile TaxID=2488639 RepID=UPI001CF560F1|nr:Ca2+-dependent phosphoinositide-specific phospholipase C [Pectobacterium versatile]MCA6935961.1 hypothetical protein [Pectobacterium versatile]
MDYASIRYNQVQQKSSHNAYQRTEGYPCQALYWRIRSLEIDIHNSNSSAGWPQLNGNWYVYHIAVVDQTTSVNTLVDALDTLHAFHLAVPNHEVITIWLDLKDDFVKERNQTPESLDNLIASKLGRENIWGPPDLIQNALSLQAAIANNQWPTLQSLRGKFIFGCTTGDLSSPTSVLNQYVENGATANQRLAFVAPQITKSDDIIRHNYAVIFNLAAGNMSLAKQVFAAGYISRVYGLNGKSDWDSAKKTYANHLGTNKVNVYTDGWARTDLPDTGYPFTGIDVALPADTTEPGQLYAINVDSGDIWSKADSFYFQYDEVDTSVEHTFTAFVSNPQSHTDDFIKGGLMARAGVANDAAYIAIFQTARNAIRMQYRQAQGNTSERIDARIPNGGNGLPIVGNNTPIWFQLTLKSGGKTALGRYSVDGERWYDVGNITVSQMLPLSGWAASSHSAGKVKWLFGGAHAPHNSAVIGNRASGSFISNNAEAASLGPYR